MPCRRPRTVRRPRRHVKRVDLLTLIGTAVALAMDTFAVGAAVTASLPQVTRRHLFRLSWHFGLFQALMPLCGWLGGSALATWLAAIDHWLAFGLLSFLGARMIWASRDASRAESADPTRGWSLVGLSVATSIDALAVGLSLGLMRVSIWMPAAVIGGVAAVLTLVGALLGRRIGPTLGQWASRVGGAVLLSIGARILIQHLCG
jgi:manganese efflux pump family protein